MSSYSSAKRGVLGGVGAPVLVLEIVGSVCGR